MYGYERRGCSLISLLDVGLGAESDDLAKEVIIKVIINVVEVAEVIGLVWSAKTELEANVWVIDLEYKDSSAAGTNKPQIWSLEAIVYFFDWSVTRLGCIRVPPETSCGILTNYKSNKVSSFDF